MKWIGQHIYDLVARFRDDVYLEDISTGTIASGSNLGLDANNKIVKATSSSGIAFDGSTANGVLTFKDSDEATVESNLIYDGTDLTATSSSDGKPVLTLKTTHTTTASSAELQFLKDAADTEDNETLGAITFYGEDEGNNNTKFAQIKGKIAESDEGNEGGKLLFGVATHDAEIQNGLQIFDGSVEDEVDVTIGSGAASLTTITGVLTMGSTATLDNNGLLQVANQSGITGVGTISSGVWQGDVIASAYMTPATDSVRGVVELATIAETTTGTDTVRVVTCDGLKDGYQGSANVVTVGTITSGTWRGTAIEHDSIGGDAIDGDNIADNAVDSEHYTDGSIDTVHIADDQVTFAKASGVTPKVFGSVIKLIPSDFMDNGDGGNTKFGVAYTDVAGTGYGMRPPNNATELYAFVSIPEGMKATHVDIFDKNDLAIEVFEAQINATTMTSKGSGNCNTTLDITDVNSSATNFLAIEVTTTSVNDRIYGGTVTIAAQ